MVKSLYILEYYEEIPKEDFYYDRYNLLGVFSKEKEAKEKSFQYYHKLSALSRMVSTRPRAERTLL